MTKKPNYFIGDKAFYKKAMAIAVPIMFQNGITNFVNLLDNIMVGCVGTEQMSAVAIVNKLVFIYNLCLFGGCAGIGVFTAQFFGRGDYENVRKTFRMKLYSNILILIGAFSIFTFFGGNLISLFLHEANGTENLAITYGYAKKYLFIIMFGMIPQSLTECYSGTLRETQNTKLPMLAGASSVLTNMTLNYILIFGNFGAPKLGVEGAAIATVISKFVELSVVSIASHTNIKKYDFFKGLYSDMRLSFSFIKSVLPTSLPLLINETLWATGVASLTYCYSLRGLDVVAGYNISSTVSDLFNVASLALGSAIAIIVGNLLGANKMEEAKRTDARLIVFSLFISVFLCAVLYFLAPFFPMLYTNTADSAKKLATSFLRIYSFYLIINTMTGCCYFTLRSGGKTLLTFLFDSVYMICISFTFTFIIARFTNISIVPLYALSLSIDIIKAILGYIFVKSGKWIQNITVR